MPQMLSIEYDGDAPAMRPVGRAGVPLPRRNICAADRTVASPCGVSFTKGERAERVLVAGLRSRREPTEFSAAPVKEVTRPP